jgi:hypothetical protein
VLTVSLPCCGVLWGFLGTTRAARGSGRTAADALRRPARTYRPEGQHSSEVQHRPHCLTRSVSSRCVRPSVNKATNGYCSEFGTKRVLSGADPGSTPARWLI